LNFIETCRKIIAIDSTPDSGCKEIALFAASIAKDLGLYAEVQEETVHSKPEANVIIRLNENRPDLEFMLQSHLDTVDPGPFGAWMHTGFNPFDASIIDNKIYGLGSADVKLDFICKLKALSEVKAILGEKKTSKLSPVLVGTFAEETGMHGALRLIRKHKVNPKMALLSEPSNLNLITAAKGFATVSIKIPFSKSEIDYRAQHNLSESSSTQTKMFSGQPAHSSTPNLGDSAIIKMLDYMLQLPERVAIMDIDGGIRVNSVPGHASLEVDIVSSIESPVAIKLVQLHKYLKSFQKELMAFSDPEFDPSYPTINIGVVRTFSDHVFLGGSCRIPPNISQEQYESWMQNIAQLCEQIGAEFKVEDYKRPYRTPENSMLVRGCLSEIQRLNSNAKCITQPNTNEASLFSRINIECVGFGAGLRQDNVHTPNEHVKIDDLELSVEFYKKCLERFCL
jgi:acetylornithine deacetylase/succinyl-diaminopimelate desuccinylase-like protein